MFGKKVGAPEKDDVMIGIGIKRLAAPAACA